MSDSEGQGGWGARLWKRPKSKWLLGIPLGGFAMIFVGAIGLGTANFIMHETSSTEFCFGCHSHELFIRPEYEASSHFRNASGVRAGCADCHLPHGWFELTWTKMVVSADIVPEVMGKISTREKYEAHREHMAETVWAEYRANDSQYCRHCHTLDAMDFEAQGRMAGRRHQRLVESSDKTCIDCHKGLAHLLPGEWEQQQQQAQPDEEQPEEEIAMTTP